MTTDAIILQIARIKDEKFHAKTTIHGNAPLNPDLKELFLQSGFYEYVKTNGQKPPKTDTLIHKITNNKVEPLIAKQACLVGLKHVFDNEEIFDPLCDRCCDMSQNQLRQTNHQKSYKSLGYFIIQGFVHT